MQCEYAFDENGDVQIKMTAGNSVGMYSCCDRLVVLRVVSTDEAEIIYDGSGNTAWENAGKMQKTGLTPDQPSSAEKAISRNDR